MKILLTGAAGFIGMHLTLALKALGHDIVGIDNINALTYDASLKFARLAHLGINIDPHAPMSEHYQYQSEHLRFYRLDLLSFQALQNLIAQEQFDLIIHLAALAGVRKSIEMPRAYFESNITGFFNLLESIRLTKMDKKPLLIFASSSSVYGDCDRVPFKEDDYNLKAESFYAASKSIDETLAQSYHTLYNLSAIALRFFTVYGPFGRPDMAPFLFTKAISENKSITLFNQGKLRRDFTFVDDIVQGIVNIVIDPNHIRHNKNVYEVYNIGRGSPIELFTFVSTLESILNTKAQIILGEMQKGDVHETFADVSKLEKDYNFRPQTSLSSGLNSFVKWYKDYYA